MLKKQTLGPKGIHCEECILKETSFPSCLTPLGIQFPFSLAGVALITAQQLHKTPHSGFGLKVQGNSSHSFVAQE